MNITVLDGYTLNPGDLSWEPLKALGNVAIYDRTPLEKIEERLQNSDIVLTNKTPLSRDVIQKLPNLKYIGLLATGYNVVDIEAASERNIPVTNIPTYGSESVAQMVFAHILNLTQHTAEHAQTVKDKKWCKSEDFCYWDYPLIELKGLKMGVIGFGRIGRATAKLALAFEMEVLAFDAYDQKNLPDGVTMTDLDTLFTESDIISLHCPLTPENKGLINQARLTQMKKSAIVINTSRGPLINEQDLAEALNSGKIAGAGLDVLEKEPADPGNPLLTAKNCYITPHISWATKSARSRLMNTAVENVNKFLQGRIQNVVNRFESFTSTELI
jgi:glycerate dehydrogenase